MPFNINPAPSWFSSRLASECRTFGLELTEKQLQLLTKHAEWVMYWNRVSNLMGNVSWEDLITVHYLDSVIPIKWLPASGRLLDVGTGAGFPGVPLGVVNDNLDVILCDTRKKRVSFLKVFLAYAGLSSIEVTSLPWQELLENRNCSFDIVTTRALRLEPKDVEYVINKGLSRSGVLAMWSVPDEGFRRYCGVRGVEIKIFKYDLPDGRKRSLVLIKKS